MTAVTVGLGALALLHVIWSWDGHRAETTPVRARAGIGFDVAASLQQNSGAWRFAPAPVAVESASAPPPVLALPGAAPGDAVAAPKAEAPASAAMSQVTPLAARNVSVETNARRPVSAPVQSARQAVAAVPEEVPPTSAMGSSGAEGPAATPPPVAQPARPPEGRMSLAGPEAEPEAMPAPSRHESHLIRSAPPVRYPPRAAEPQRVPTTPPAAPSTGFGREIFEDHARVGF